MKRWVLLSVLVCLMVAVISNAAFGALNAYLKLKGVDGESTKSDHEKWIIIESFGARSPALPTAAQGKTGPGQFSIRHVANVNISPAILRLMLSKQVFDMPLDVMEGTTLVHYMVYGCAISAYSADRSGSEEITFTYQGIERLK